MFNNRKLVIATKHEKEIVIVPLLERSLRCSMCVFWKNMQCNLPTSSTLSYIYTCQKCFYSKEEMYPNKKTTEDPMYCDVCNP